MEKWIDFVEERNLRREEDLGLDVSAPIWANFLISFHDRNFSPASISLSFTPFTNFLPLRSIVQLRRFLGNCSDYINPGMRFLSTIRRKNAIRSWSNKFFFSCYISYFSRVSIVPSILQTRLTFSNNELL